LTSSSSLPFRIRTALLRDTFCGGKINYHKGKKRGKGGE
jgi:hypothetical protein